MFYILRRCCTDNNYRQYLLSTGNSKIKANCSNHTIWSSERGGLNFEGDILTFCRDFIALKYNVDNLFDLMRNQYDFETNLYMIRLFVSELKRFEKFNVFVSPRIRTFLKRNKRKYFRPRYLKKNIKCGWCLTKYKMPPKPYSRIQDIL